MIAIGLHGCKEGVWEGAVGALRFGEEGGRLG